MWAFIYKIILTEIEFYIGSTKNLKQRKEKHNYSLHNENCKNYNFKLYKKLREAGVEVIELEVIYTFECENNEDRRKMEQDYMDEMLPTLNDRRAYCSEEYKKAWYKEYGKIYYQNNKEQLNMRNKIWAQNNKEMVTKQNKIWYENNIEMVTKQNKMYKEKNKELVAKWHKLWYEKNIERLTIYHKTYRDNNKDTINAQKTQIIICECGCESTNTNIARHRKTKRHEKLMLLKLD